MIWVKLGNTILIFFYSFAYSNRFRIGYLHKVRWTLMMLLQSCEDLRWRRLWFIHHRPLLLNGWQYRWTSIVQRFVWWLHAQCVSCKRRVRVIL